MEIWAFVQQNTIAIITAIVTAVGAYFGARSYFLAERKKQEEEIGRIKQLLVGSSEVSVQNLTNVIEALRSRVDRLEEDRTRIQNLLDEERERARNLEEEKSKLVEEVAEGRNRIERMQEEIRKLKRDLNGAREEVENMKAGGKTALYVTEGYDWASPPYRKDNS